MIKMANEEVHARIRRARAVIAAGVRLKKPDLEREGREEFAEACVENQILLYGSDLTSESKTRLIRALHDTDKVELSEELQVDLTPADIVSQEELEARFDPQGEYEDDEPDYVEPEDN